MKNKYKKVVFTTKLLLIPAIAIFMISCGSGGGQLSHGDPQANQAQTQIVAVDGEAALGLIRDAGVEIYEISGEHKHCDYQVNPLKLLGAGRTQTDGSYNISIELDETADDVYLLYRIARGSYVEEASGRSVSLRYDQAIHAVRRLNMQQLAQEPQAHTQAHISMMINSWTNIQAGLFCYLIEYEDMAMEQALQTISDFTDDFLGFDPRFVSYEDPTDAKNSRIDLELDDGLRLGFANAGLSELSRQISLAAGEPQEHTEINSVFLAGLFYDDISFDGKLDGIGANGKIRINREGHITPINATTYREILPRATIEFYDENPNNQVRAAGSRDEVYALAYKINETTHPLVFADLPKARHFDLEAPSLSWLSDTTLSGEVRIGLKADDLTAVSSLRLAAFPDIPISRTESIDAEDANYQFDFDTKRLGSGDHSLVIIAEDTLGNIARHSFDIKLVNLPPRLKQTSLNTTKIAGYRYSFETAVIDQQVIDYEASSCQSQYQPQGETYYVLHTGNEVWCNINLPQNGAYELSILLCDTYKNCATHESVVVHDSAAPEIRIENFNSLDPSYETDVAFYVEIKDKHSGLAKPISYSVIPESAAPNRGASIDPQIMPEIRTIATEHSSIILPLSTNPDEEMEARYYQTNRYLVSFDGSRFGRDQVLFSISAEDSLGNNALQEYRFNIENEPPEITLTSDSITDQDFYFLSAKIDPKRYKGSYKAICLLDGRPIIASIVGNSLNCNIHIGREDEGAIDIEIVLTAQQNGDRHQKNVRIIRDTKAPELRLTQSQNRYSATGEELIIKISDDNLDPASAIYSISSKNGDREVINNLIRDIPLTTRGIGTNQEWYLILPNSLPTGAHSIHFTAADSLGNQAMLRHDFVIVKDEPSLTLTSARLSKDDSYVLTANIDPKSYQGEYTAFCVLGRQELIATIRGNSLVCNLDLAPEADGDIDIEIRLVPMDYDDLYEQSIVLVRDTQAPELSFISIEDKYTLAPDTLRSLADEEIILKISDANLDISTPKYSLNGAPQISLTTRGTGTNQEWYLSLPSSLTTGRHSLTFTAADTLGSDAEISHAFVVLRDEPSLSLTSAPSTRNDAYSLRARIDPKTYTGSYDVICILDGEEIVARLRDNLLSCVLNLTEKDDGDVDVRIMLTAHYGETYSRSLSVIKDKTGPTIDCSFQLSYGINPFNASCQVEDTTSNIARVQYSDLADSDKLHSAFVAPDGRSSSTNYVLAFDPAELFTGRHQTKIIAVDSLGNRQERSYSFFVVTEPLTLNITSPLHTNQQTIDIEGTWTSPSPLSSIICLRPHLGSLQANVQAEISGDSFVCRDFSIADMSNPGDVMIQSCDIFNNCAMASLRVIYDALPPVGESFVDINNSYYNRFRKVHPKTEVYNRQNGYLFAPNSFAFSEQLVTLRGISEIHGTNTYSRISEYNEEELNLTADFLESKSRLYVAWRGKDQTQSVTQADGTKKVLYNTPASRLRMKYSYRQVACTIDDIDADPKDYIKPSYSHLSDEEFYKKHCFDDNLTTYFTDRMIEPFVRQSDGDAEFAIPFTSEYLNVPGKAPWYNVPHDVIHRIDLSVCDEADNCIEYVTRFRIQLRAAYPVVNEAQIPVIGINHLKNINSYKYNYHTPFISRAFTIHNRHENPVYFTISPPEEQDTSQIIIHRRKYVRINGYRNRRIVWSSRRDPSYQSSDDCSYNCRRYIHTPSWGAYIDDESIVRYQANGISTSAGRSYTSSSSYNYFRATSKAYPLEGFPQNADIAVLENEEYPKGSLLGLSTTFVGAVDEKNIPYDPNIFYRLEPGETKIIWVQESLPPYNTYYSDHHLNRLLPHYSWRSVYNHRAEIRLYSRVKIRYARPNIADNGHQPASVRSLSILDSDNKYRSVTTTGRFHRLISTP